jgi:hypothetical protein
MAMFAALASGAPLGSVLYSRWGFIAIALATALIPLASMLVVTPLASVPLRRGARSHLLKVARAVWLPGLGSALTTFGFGGLIAFSSLLSAERNWNPVWLLFSAFAAALVVARLFLGHLPDRLGGARVALISAGIEAIGLALIWSAPGRLVAATGAVLTGIGYHCFGSLRALFEEYQQDTSFISERQNADSIYGNERTAKAVIGAGQAALTFIDLSTVWVSAEFKENSLEYMSTADRAELVFDSLPGAVFKAHVESIGWGVSQNSVDPNTGLPTIKNATGWVRDPQRFPVRLVVDEPPPRGSVRFGSQVNVVVYTGRNSVTNALGAVFIRLVSMLTYAS